MTQLARPLPVEYLLVDMPAAFPVDPVFTFHAEGDRKPFVIENRSEIGELQVMYQGMLCEFQVKVNVN